MSSDVKFGKEIPGAEAFYDIFNNGVQAAVTLQKKALDLALQQNADTVEACKKSIKSTPLASSAPLFDLAGQVFEKYVGLQKGLIDLTVEQTNAATQLQGLRHEAPARVASSVAGFVQQSVDRGVTAQKLALDVAAQQNKLVGEALKQQLSGTPAAAAADTIQRGVDTLIETQKNVLEIASKPLKNTAASA